MLTNINTVLFGPDLNMIPYKKEHVKRYHEWMDSEELLEKTASERLSLEQEYEMQVSWSKDDDKCTFILFADFKFNGLKELPVNEESNKPQVQGKLIGDVNLFLNDMDDPTSAEIEIMIAEKEYRNKGLGKLAILMMINYGFRYLNLTKITCKIGDDNSDSLRLFKEKLGFEVVSYSKVFEETTLELSLQKESETMTFIDTLEQNVICEEFDKFDFSYQ